VNLRAWIQGRGPEQVQHDKVHANRHVAMRAGIRRVALQDPAGMRWTSLDTPSPQVVVRTRMVDQYDAVASTPGGRFVLPFAPPAVSPVSWDGEPGYTAPVGDR
jgi:hypothetical protein